jgi:hypothetical protein
VVADEHEPCIDTPGKDDEAFFSGGLDHAVLPEEFMATTIGWRAGGDYGPCSGTGPRLDGEPAVPQIRSWGSRALIKAGP